MEIIVNAEDLANEIMRAGSILADGLSKGKTSEEIFHIFYHEMKKLNRGHVIRCEDCYWRDNVGYCPMRKGLVAWYGYCSRGVRKDKKPTVPDSPFVC